MNKQNKQLLLKALCGYLPYGVKIQYGHTEYDLYSIDTTNVIIVRPFMSNLEGHPIETIKVYLRPMSSMTEEEKNEHFGRTMTIDIVQTSKEVIDWLNAHHFDYRGLIEKGLALEAPEEMYETKTE